MKQLLYGTFEPNLKVMKLQNQPRLDPKATHEVTHWAVERTVTTKRWFRSPVTITETVIVEVAPSSVHRLWPSSNYAPDWAVNAIDRHGCRIVTEEDEEVQQLLTSGNDIDKMRAAK